VTGAVEVEKPALPHEEEVATGTPEPKAQREVWWQGGFETTPIFEQDVLSAGHEIAGPAVIESPADTFAVPPGRRVRLDSNRIFHLTSEES